MRILVPGGAGFIGSHLCERLVNEEHEVICIDNFFTGRMKNIQHLREKSNFTVYHHDVIEPISAPIKKIDQIYNLACPASPPHYQMDRIQTAETCFLGAKNLLDLARQHGSRILQASTSEVYGDPLEHPQHEGYWGNVNPNGPRSCYDEGKRIAETLFLDNEYHYQTDIRIARIFNTYGPNMRDDDGRIVSNFICQALKGEPITVYGDGLQTRSFCYVSDMVEGLIRLMNSSIAPSTPINLGNPNEFTVIALATKVCNMLDSKSKIKYLPLPVDDPRVRKPYIEKAKKYLNWEPSVQIDEGLRHTSNYFIKELFTSTET